MIVTGNWTFFAMIISRIGVTCNSPEYDIKREPHENSQTFQNKGLYLTTSLLNMCSFVCTLLLLTCTFTVAVWAEEEHSTQFCVIGAGPGGIKMKLRLMCANCLACLSYSLHAILTISVLLYRAAARIFSGESRSWLCDLWKKHYSRWVGSE